MSEVIAFPRGNAVHAETSAPQVPAVPEGRTSDFAGGAAPGTLVHHADQAAIAMDQGLQAYLTRETVTLAPMQRASIVSLSGSMLLANFFYDCGGRNLDEFDQYLTMVAETMRLHIQRRHAATKRGEG